MYSRKLVVCHDQDGFFIGVLERDPSDSYIGEQGWITPLSETDGIDVRSDDQWFDWVHSYEGMQYGYFEYCEGDGVYYIN